VFVTGVILLFDGPGSRGRLLLWHKVSFFVWLAAMAPHVLAHLPELPRSLGGKRATEPPCQACRAAVAAGRSRSPPRWLVGSCSRSFSSPTSPPGRRPASTCTITANDPRTVDSRRCGGSTHPRQTLDYRDRADLRRRSHGRSGARRPRSHGRHTSSRDREQAGIRSSESRGPSASAARDPGTPVSPAPPSDRAHTDPGARTGSGRTGPRLEPATGTGRVRRIMSGGRSAYVRRDPYLHGSGTAGSRLP
jgi:hypothetical protein